MYNLSEMAPSVGRMFSIRSCQCAVRSTTFFMPTLRSRAVSSRISPKAPLGWINNASQDTCMSHSRSFSSTTLIQFITPPCVFAGLVTTLWFYKCMMLIIFQNKIIYMPSIPPFSRSEKLSDYQYLCKSVNWQQHYIKSLDGVKIAFLIGEVNGDLTKLSRKYQRRNFIVYFQG